MKKTSPFFLYLFLLNLLLLLHACKSDDNPRHTVNTPKNIKIKTSFGKNALRTLVSFECETRQKAMIEYWDTKQPKSIFITKISPLNRTHAITLTNLKFSTQYEGYVVSVSDNEILRSKKISFNTSECPDDLFNIFRASAAEEKNIPSSFRNGCVLVHKMLPPAIIALCDVKGKIRWYHRFNNTGVKVASFTPQGTIIALLGNPNYPMASGNEIMELSLTGDTLFHLKKGEKALQDTITHEILKDDEGNIITLPMLKKVMDLSSIGRGKNEEVGANSILVLDKNGNKVWDWSLFDATDVLKEKSLLTHQHDVFHANSIALDKDGNFIVSLYMQAQVWKIDRKTKKVLWKLGKGGDFSLPKNALFEHSHTAHYSNLSQVTLFNNGTSNKTSQVLSFTIDDATKTARPDLILNLSSGAYSQFMGSGYWIDDNYLYTCASMQQSVFLFDKKGDEVWKMSFPFKSYRSAFVPYDKLHPYIVK